MTCVCRIDLDEEHPDGLAVTADLLGHGTLETSFVPVDGGAESFWRRCGFQDTGRTRSGEPVFAKAL